MMVKHWLPRATSSTGFLGTIRDDTERKYLAWMRRRIVFNISQMAHEDMKDCYVYMSELPSRA